MKKLLAMAALALGNLIGSQTLYAATDWLKLDSEIRDIFAKQNMTALSIAAVKGDSIVYQNAYGYRVMPSDATPRGEILETDDVFKIASVSKTFIATAIMRLVEEGKLTLDDDAQKYLPFKLRNPKYPKDPITVKMLLDHTSSINDNRSWWNIDYINSSIDKNYTQCYSPEAPGEQYRYCNMNYTLLGVIIENITKKRFDVVVDEYIMNPLGLTGNFNIWKLDRNKCVQLYWMDEKSGVLTTSDEAYRLYPNLKDDKYKLQKSLGLEYPAAGMKISAPDLAKYMMMHMYGGSLDGVYVISPESETEMRKNYVGEYNYGLSFRNYSDLIPGQTLYGQTGGGYGIKTCMIFDPELEIGFVVLSAGGDTEFADGYGDIHKPIIKSLYKNLFDGKE